MSRGGTVAGGRRRTAPSLIALAISVVALAIAAPAASATTDRADYDAQVNPICASANAQAKQLYDQLEELASQLPKSGSAHGPSTDRKRRKKGSKLQRRVNRLFSQLPFQVQAIYDTELAQLKQAAPAPGDETLVSNWLTNRQTLQDLNRQANDIEARIERLINRVFSRRKISSFEKFQRKETKLEKQANAIYGQIESVRNKDVELGTQLGATYCVTDATGTP